jgi:DNA-directed RNA polymerase subunit RPC12/RpoP
MRRLAAILNSTDSTELPARDALHMTIDLTCQKCDTSFEIEAAEIIDGNEPIKCPNCDARAPQGLVDDFASALGELCKQTAALSKRFSLSMAVESDDLPPPYDTEEEEEEEEESDEDELFDEDEDEDEDYEDDEDDDLADEDEESDEDF